MSNVMSSLNKTSIRWTMRCLAAPPSCKLWSWCSYFHNGKRYWKKGNYNVVECLRFSKKVFFTRNNNLNISPKLNFLYRIISLSLQLIVYRNVSLKSLWTFTKNTYTHKQRIIYFNEKKTSYACSMYSP